MRRSPGGEGGALSRQSAGADTSQRMAFADWLLPLMLLTPDDEGGHPPFDWAAFDALPIVTPNPAA